MYAWMNAHPAKKGLHNIHTYKHTYTYTHIYIHRVAKRDLTYRGKRPAYTSLWTDELVFIHPHSCLRNTAPDWIAYCEHIRVCVCVCVCLCMYVCIHVCVHAYACICLCLRVCEYLCWIALREPYILVYMPSYLLYLFMIVHVNTCIHTYMYAMELA